MKKILLIIFTLLLIALNLVFGSVSFDIFSWASMSIEQQELLTIVLLENRLPRTLLAFFAGASCGIAGLIMQTIFKNPLAGPTTLGINSGASLGIAFFYFVLSSFNVLPLIHSEMIFSILGAFLFLLLIVFVALRYKSVTTILIIGILLGYVAFSLIEILVQNASDAAISSYVFWGMGSFNQATWFNVSLITAISLVSALIFMSQSNRLNLYLLGDDELLLSGHRPQRLRVLMIIVCGVLVGVLTSIVGPLAFLGIAVPNFLKLQLKTMDHKQLIPYSFFLGGAFAVLADFIARGILFDAVYPLNAVLSLIAIPIIIVILFKNRRDVAGA